MTRAEMLDAVRRLFIANGTEEELDQLRNELVKAAPHSGISNPIYYPDQEPNKEQIVDQTLRREQDYAAKNIIVSS